MSEFQKSLVKAVEVKDQPTNGSSIDECKIKALADADSIWKLLKAKDAADPEFGKTSEQYRIDWVQRLNLDFQHNFPIVCRYMVCKGQYSRRAFKMYLDKIYAQESKRVNYEKGEREDAWCKRQADYVKYLWAATNCTKGKMSTHFMKMLSHRDANVVWNSTYQSLKKEFKDYREMHDKISADIKIRDRENERERSAEAVDVLIGGKYELPESDIQRATQIAKIMLCRQHKRKCMQQLLSKCRMREVKHNYAITKKDIADPVYFNPVVVSKGDKRNKEIPEGVDLARILPQAIESEPV